MFSRAIQTETSIDDLLSFRILIPCGLTEWFIVGIILIKHRNTAYLRHDRLTPRTSSPPYDGRSTAFSGSARRVLI